jgi:hypothetical protein
MKKIALLMTVLSCTWLGVPTHAQDQGDKDRKPPKPGFGDGGPREKMRMRFMENLSPENQERFEAAREKAMQDPALQELRKAADQANRDFFKAVRDKMMEIDPGLSDIVKKNFHPPGKGPKKGDMPPPPAEAMGGPEGKPSKPEGKGWRGQRKEGALSGLAGMTEAERQQYMAARETAKNDPAVQDAEKKKKEASTPEARQAAAEEYRKAMAAAIVKVDPSLAPLVEKTAPPEKPKPDPQAGPEGATMAPQMME